MSKLSLELDGSINVVETDDDGNVLSCEPIDGEICLKVILEALREALKEQ